MMRAVIIWLALATSVLAVEPGEMLEDPALEARARAISQNLRCLVCRNESIDESHADLARDLRVLVRERIAGGDTNEEAVAFIVDRYGEYVLLKPNTSGANLILWIAGPAVLLAALAIAFGYVIRRRPGAVPDGLSDDEQARLAELTRD